MEERRPPACETRAALRDRLSRLSQASLHINASLDFDTVLQGVLDSARSLIGARYGVMTLLDDEGGVQHALASGLSAEEAEQLWAMADGPRIFDALIRIDAPMRVEDLAVHVRAQGFPDFAIPIATDRAFAVLAAPMFHRGARVGHVFVGDRDDGGAFTRTDEETLVMFASQAALVIANARTLREERRARKDLETLIDTSPVGVVVFDASTGAPKSLNREARRIVQRLRKADQTHEQIIGELTLRRADGREVSLREYPMAGLLSTGETVRAEEIVMRVPDGRSVTVLLNATPIHADDGRVESVVVTMQDMADVEEMERLRAEFLAIVSHELRAPLTSIKGSAATLLESPGDMDPAVVRQFFRIIGDQADHMNGLVSDLLDVARIETGTLAVTPEPAEMGVLVARARSAFAIAGGRNSLAIDIASDLPLVLADRRRIVQVLGNLLANAARHGSQSSVISVSAVRDGVHVAVSVANEGRGIPAESLPLLFRKFSSVHSEEHGGDTGLGLAICKGIVEAHGGRIWAESEGPGFGARFTFTLPLVDAGSAAEVARLASRPRFLRPGQSDARDRLRVLAVDDDPHDLRYVRDTLIRSGYTPTVTGDPEEALRLAEEHRPHLVLLDLMLPGTDGIQLMKSLLEKVNVPVIFLSAYGRDELIAEALNMGAADYVVKPFSPTELSARIAAALRRRAALEPKVPYVYRDLVIDYAKRSVTLAGEYIHMVPMEYRMLGELAASAGRVLTYEHLLERVWGEGSSDDGDLRPMRTIVRKLRQKLRDDAINPTYIFTEQRVGYWMPKGTDKEADS